MGLWISFLLQGDTYSLLGHFSPLEWHMHEMLFGFLPAAIAGFLLTAVPNWTGRLPVRGAPLGLLACLWGAGRVANLFAGWIGQEYYGVIAGLDSLFLIAFAALLAREILAGNNKKNLPVVGIVMALATSNILFHMIALDLIDTFSTRQIALAATLLATLLVTLIGGRIVPSFTRNWMVRNKVTPLPASRDIVDLVGSVYVPLSALLLLTAPETKITGALCLSTGLIHLYRMSRWHGLATFKEPLVLVLHIGYSWIGIGFFIAGLSILSDSVSMVAAIHAFTSGMIGTMILAVMTRATRGHSGQALEADAGTLVIFVLVTLSALIRVGTALNGPSEWGYLLSGAVWTSAFALFVILYIPLFLRR